MLCEARLYLMPPVLAIAVLWSGSVQAGSITPPYPDPNPFSVTCTDENGFEHTLGDLNIDVYIPRAYLDEDNNVRGGAGMEATFSGFQNPDCYIEYDFVQAIVGGNSTIGDPPYLDPFVWDDAYPFYWTDTERADNYSYDANTGAFELTITDYPSMPASVLVDHNPATIMFETALVCVDYENFTVNFLQSFTWGYTFSYNAATQTYMSVLDQMQWIDPSQTIMDLVDDWPTFAPKGDGSWNVTEGECCDCDYPIPEPATVTLLLLGVALAGTRRVLAA